MYESYYGLNERPFSITPDPRYVFLSQRHRDGLAHLLFGVGRGGGGGFVQLTGEVGTGKTTLCRLLLEQVPEKTRIALILNPMLEPRELLQAICDELEIDTTDTNHSVQQLGSALNRFLLDAHAEGERVVLIIDEAQNMSREALEQIRMLTNLETATDKLLQIILLGQPELRAIVARPELRQLAQRITARYHLEPLNRQETMDYVRHRLAVAGAPRCPFTGPALKKIFSVSGGVPRLINIIADRALMAGYARDRLQVGPRLVGSAAREVLGERIGTSNRWARGVVAAVALVVVLGAGGGMAWLLGQARVTEPKMEVAAMELLEETDARQAFAEAAGLWRGGTAGRFERACSEGMSDGFACQVERGTWAAIERFNHPVILRLSQPEGAHVLLVGMDGSRVGLQQDGNLIVLGRSDLEDRWKGDFLVIWPDDGQVFRPGDQGQDIADLRELAAGVAGPSFEGGAGEDYDEEFTNWVESFQRHHGLVADGIIGPSTRLFLTVPQLDRPGLLRDLGGDQ